MKRRDLLKAIIAAPVFGTGVGITGSFIAPKAYGAVSDSFFVHIHAGGGWDVTSIMDPKGNNTFYDDSRGPMNMYRASDIRSAGNLRYAPVLPGLSEGTGDELGEFFPKHYHRLMVINGVDHLTNGHGNGYAISRRGSKSGAVADLAALYGAQFGDDLPMALLGDANTQGVVPQSKTEVMTKMHELTNPNLMRGNAKEILPNELFQAVQDFAQQELDHGLYAQEELLQINAMQMLSDARGSMADLNRLASFLPSTPSLGFESTTENIAAAFAAGVSTSAGISFGNFDTHSNGDQRTILALNELLRGVDHLWNELERHGIDDRTTIAISSDFGRTPWYNDSPGKDHWNVTSWMFMGQGVPGNRLIGATNDQLKCRKVNSSTLELDDNGTTITGPMIHKSMRRLLGLEGSILDQAYPLDVEFLDIFG